MLPMYPLSPGSMMDALADGSPRLRAIQGMSQIRTSQMSGTSELAFRAAILRHEVLVREAERMGAIRYELSHRQRQRQRGPGSIHRLRASAGEQFSVVRALLATSLRIRLLAER